MIVNQRAEWLNQIRNALRLNLTEEARSQAASRSLWHGLVSARSQIMNALGTVAENFKGVLLPAVQAVATGLQKLAALTDPATGNPWLRMGLLGGGTVGGFMLLRRLAGAMSRLARTLLGAWPGIRVRGASAKP
jgi:hypothetical protein